MWSVKFCSRYTRIRKKNFSANNLSPENLLFSDISRMLTAFRNQGLCVVEKCTGKPIPLIHEDLKCLNLLVAKELLIKLNNKTITVIIVSLGYREFS